MLSAPIIRFLPFTIVSREGKYEGKYQGKYAVSLWALQNELHTAVFYCYNVTYKNTKNVIIFWRVHNVTNTRSITVCITLLFPYLPWYWASVSHLASASGLGQILGTSAKYQVNYGKSRVILSIYTIWAISQARIVKKIAVEGNINYYLQ